MIYSSDSIFLTLIISFCCILVSCKTNVDNETIIATVYSDKLTQTQLESALGSSSQNEEIKAQFIDSWIKKQLILNEANKNSKFDREINQLVRDYKESLLIQKHKTDYLSKKLEQDISEQELIDAYAEIKEDYKLRQKIFKTEILITPADHFDKLDLKNYFKKGEYDEWKSSLSNLVDFHLQDTSKWYTWSQIEQYIPSDLLQEGDIEEKEKYFLENQDHLFFVRIFELIDENEMAPLSYMEDKLKSAILEKRKEFLLKDYSSTLYKSALENNKIVQ